MLGVLALLLPLLPGTARAAAPTREPLRVVLSLAPGDAGALVTARTATAPGASRQALAEARPSATARARVAQVLRRSGFTLDPATDPWTVSATAPADRAAQVFGTRLVGTADALRPTNDPVLPPSLSRDVLAVNGLDTAFRSTPRSTVDPRATTLTYATAGYHGDDLRSAYAARGTSPGGAGTTIATVQFSGWDSSQVDTYANAAGITLAPGQVTNVPVPPLTASDTNTPDGNGGDFEVALDVETALSVAPAAEQRTYVTQNTQAGAAAIYSQIANDAEAGLVTVVSTSWGSCEQETPTSMRRSIDLALQRMLAAGATVFAASGDYGTLDCSGKDYLNDTAVDYPASSPYVVGVGGTRLTGSSTRWSEAAWGSANADAGGSGGGRSLVYAQPTWQSAARRGEAMRTVPDISSVADPSTGVAIYATLTDAGGRSSTGWYSGGGTSAGSPAQAGLLASAVASRGESQGPGNVLPALYSASAAAYRDVTTGRNDLYPATPGYDLVTGLGSPQWSVLFDVVDPLPGGFTVLPARRVLDSRKGVGLSGPLGGRSTPYRLVLPRTGASAVPDDATAVALTLTATAAQGSGHVQVVPGGSAAASTSNLNYVVGEEQANLVITPVGRDSAGNPVLDLIIPGSPTYLVADLSGWSGPSAPSRITSQSPARFLDTRYGTGVDAAGRRAPGVFTAQLPAGAPADATAVVFTLTATSVTGRGFVTAFESGTSVARVSNLNARAGQTQANLVVVPLGSSPTVSFYLEGITASVIGDVAGYVRPAAGDELVALAPQRVLDTRHGVGVPRTAPAAAGSTTTLALPSSVPAAATGVVLTVTSTGGQGIRYVTVYPTGTSRPRASNLNLSTGQTRANLVVVPIGTNRSVSLYLDNGPAELIVDLNGYLLPPPPATG